MVSKETRKKYREKKYRSDKILGELYRGEGGKDNEPFGNFKKRVKRLI